MRCLSKKSFLLILMSLIRIYQPGKRDLIDFFLFYLKELYLRAFPFFIFNHLLEEDNNDCWGNLKHSLVNSIFTRDGENIKNHKRSNGESIKTHNQNWVDYILMLFGKDSLNWSSHTNGWVAPIYHRRKYECQMNYENQICCLPIKKLINQPKELRCRAKLFSSHTISCESFFENNIITNLSNWP